MSRIDEALKRSGGGLRDSRAPSALSRYGVERAPRPDDGNITPFVAAGPHVVEQRPDQPPDRPERRQTPQAAAPPQQIPDERGNEGEPPQEDERLVDVRQFADYAGFVRGAIRRHPMLVAATFGVVLAMTGITLAVMPKTYHAQAKLLAQKNEVMAALSNPGRAVPWDADSPTRAAAETVLRRDNLISMIGQTNLMEEWHRTRAPILRVKDGLTRIVFRRPPTVDEELDRLVGYLEGQMTVVTGPAGDGTVTIDLDWPNAQMAFRLVEAAQQTFLEARQRAETAAIGESIGILERYSATLHENINHTLTEIQRTQAAQRPAAVSARTAARLAPAPAAARHVTTMLPPVPAALLGSIGAGAGLDDPEIPRLKAQLAPKQRELANLEETRQRQLADLNGRLAQLTTIYTPSHPNVQAVQKNISALSHDAPEIATLKQEVSKLSAEYQQRVDAVAELEQEEQRGKEATRRAAVDADARVAREREPAPRPAAAEQPTATVATMSEFSAVQLRLELNQLQSVLERTDGARIELAVSQAAFKYRYTVIKPAQVPRAPTKPNAALILGTGLVAGLLFAVATAVGKDILSNRIVEQWQVERQLELPVLATVGGM